MERFVFVAAIVVAVFFGIAALVGPHMDVDFDIDGASASPVVALSAGQMPAAAYEGSSVRIRGAAARVVIVPEDRANIEVAIDNSAGRTPMPSVELDGGVVVIDGRLRGRIESCDGGGADLRGYDDVSAEELPVITVRTPRTVVVDRGGAGVTEIGAAESVDLEVHGCGAVTVADVTGDLEIDLAGSGEVRAGAARQLSINLAGSGEVVTGPVAGDADVDIAGSGSVSIASLSGDLSADGAGSGSLVVAGGSIGTASVDLAGSGDVSISAPVRRLDVSIVGSGDVSVEAEVGEVEADIAGSGDVNVRSVTGNVQQSAFGSGSVNVGE